MPIHRGFTIL